jgi:hypothetical protein
MPRNATTDLAARPASGVSLEVDSGGASKFEDHRVAARGVLVGAPSRTTRHARSPSRTTRHAPPAVAHRATRRARRRAPRDAIEDPSAPA